MSDQSVAEALRSDARLVLVDAAAGCGKTYQAADYAGDVSLNKNDGRVLIVTHTHAACDVFAERTERVSRQVEIRTIDSLISHVAGAYHLTLGLPHDVNAWARSKKVGYSTLANKVADLLARTPIIAAALATRYPIVVCDEHQDSSASQHAVVMSLFRAGSRLRVLGDPMQSIYGSENERTEREQQWKALVKSADRVETLDYPHRWNHGTRLLGDWIQDARQSLKRREPISFSGKPPTGVAVIRAENTATGYGQYRVDKNERKPIDAALRKDGSTLVLAAHNATVRSLRPFFNRRLPIWEGHVRNHLDSFAARMIRSTGNAHELGNVIIDFLGNVAVGFSQNGYGKNLLAEIDSGCTARRSGRPFAVQQIARTILDSPDHSGVGRALQEIEALSLGDSRFADIKIDHVREYREAIAICEYSDPQIAVGEISRRRTFARPTPSRKAISTIHKAKGLEVDRVLVLPCDGTHFGDRAQHRNLLYVAISRAKRSVTVVVPFRDPTPLVRIEEGVA